MATPLDDEQLVTLFRAYPLDHDNKAVYRARLDHELRIMRCADCGTWHEPPKPICPACWSTDVVPTPVTGRGTIFMVIFLSQGPPAPGVDYSTPYPVVTVELEEQAGLRFTSTVVGSPNDDIVIGAPVTLDWLDREGVPIPVFRLTGAPA
jgi:uncharacterized OB-fold protein